MKRWIGRTAAATAVLALTLSGCGGGGNSGGGAPGGGTAPKLTVGLLSGPQSLSPTVSITGGATLYYTPVYDSLLLLGPDGTPKPLLATAWSYNPEQTVLTLTLRAGVKFTNGEAFDAAAAKANLDRNLKTGANAQVMTAVQDVAAPEPGKLVITLAQKDPGIVAALASSVAYMQAPGTFDDPGSATKPVGTGPYTLSSSTIIGSQYSYKRNRNYWNAAAVRYDELDLKVFADQNAMLNAVKSGQVNAIQLPNGIKDQVAGSGWKVSAQELDFAGLFLFDRDGRLNPALKDKRVRQAINLAVNREALLKAVVSGMGTPTAQIFNDGNGGSLDPALDTQWAYNPDRAKALLAEAGHADLKLVLPTVAIAKTLMGAVQQQLGAVGIEVELRDAGPNYITDMLSAKYSASYFQFQAGDPWFMMQLLLQPQGVFNPFRVNDPRLLAMVDRYRTSDAVARQAVLKDINAYMTDQAWFAPWYRVQTAWATDARTRVELVKGWASPYVLNFAPQS
ncbi:ABC transporter substrate-binding protein [Streptomyces sp. NPDC055103]